MQESELVSKFGLPTPRAKIAPHIDAELFTLNRLLVNGWWREFGQFHPFIGLFEIVHGPFIAEEQNRLVIRVPGHFCPCWNAQLFHIRFLEMAR